MLSSSAIKDRKRALLNTATDHRSYTALHLAVEAGHADIAHLLIRHVRLALVAGFDACGCRSCYVSNAEVVSRDLGRMHVSGMQPCTDRDCIQTCRKRMCTCGLRLHVTHNQARHRRCCWRCGERVRTPSAQLPRFAQPEAPLPHLCDP